MEDSEMDTNTIADDGIDRPDDTEAGALPPVERALGYILEEEDEEKVAKHVVKLRADQDPRRARDRAVWKQNRWWREGRRWVKLIKHENMAMWEAKLPFGMSNAPPVPNKTDRLCRRLVNTILVDKPYPDCEPGDDSNEARDAAEFATRYLSTIGSPAQLNMSRILRAAASKAQTFASTYGWVTMDPTGNGHRPRRMLAHPLAQHKDDALTDPYSGDRAADETLQERFLRSDGYLTDNPADADLQWLPAPAVRLLTGLQVDLLPYTCTGRDDAVGMVIADTTTLGDLRLLFPDKIGALSKEQLEKLCQWRADPMEDLLPPYTPEPEDQKFAEGPRAGEYRDDQMIVTLTVYYRSCAEYPLGCYAVIGADSMVLHRQKWTAMMPSDSGPPTEECLEIPVGQCRCLDDDTNGNPNGIGIIEHLGPSDEIRASALGFELQHMFRSANPIPFLPHGSIVPPGVFARRDGTPVFTNPQGKPEWENVPALSQSIPDLRNEMGSEMDSESGLEQAGQGVEDPSVKSGIHAQTIVQEALKAVGGMRDNIGDFYIALNRIILQLTRAYCTVPQLLTFTGKDGQYKQKEWSRADFRTTKKVSIAQGSFTMHTLVAKQEMANNALDRKTIDAEEYNELVAGGVAPVLGTQDNPHLLRVRRQLDVFAEGPTPEWLAQATQADQANTAAEQSRAALATQAAAAAQQGVPVPVPPPAAPQPLPPDRSPSASSSTWRRRRPSSGIASFSGSWPRRSSSSSPSCGNGTTYASTPT
jgi:hypothetical protein